MTAGRNFKVEPKKVAKRIKRLQAKPVDIKKKFLSMTIVDSTKIQYRSAIKWLKQILKKLECTSFNEETFLLILESIEGDYCAHKAEQLRDAIMYHANTTNEWQETKSWTSKQDMINVCAGFKYKSGKANPTTRGAATEKQVDAFTRKLIQLDKHQFIPMLFIQYGLALRISQLIAIESGDYDQQQRTLLLRKDKRKGAKRKAVTPGKGEMHTKINTNQEAHEQLCMLQGIRKRGELLFPFCLVPKWEYIALFKKHFTKSGKNPDLIFTNHSLRHGGYQKIQEVEKQLFHLTKKTLSRYTSSNEERTEAIVKAGKQRTKK
jgi:integrase